MKKALIIGGGFGGCTAVHELHRIGGWNITLVNPIEELGGGVRTKQKSGHPYTFGPRHFLTHNNDVYEYLNNLVPLRLCKEHQFLSFVDQDSNFYNYPIHFDDINRMPDKDLILSEIKVLEKRFTTAKYKLTRGEPILDNVASDYEDFWKRSIGETLYEKFIRKYTNKMWQIDDNTQIDDFTWSPKGVAIKSGPREGWDSAISAYPVSLDGYNKFFDLAKNKTDELIVGKVDNIKPNSLIANIGGNNYKFDCIINTAPLDELFEYQLGKLRYIGRKLEYVILPVEFALPQNVYFAYYTGNESYTRVVEYKKFTRYSSPNTLISIEYPSLNNGKFYPMPSEEFRNQHKKYLDLCEPMFFNAGRIAKYNYRYDIDDVMEQILEFTSSL